MTHTIRRLSFVLVLLALSACGQRAAEPTPDNSNTSSSISSSIEDTMSSSALSMSSSQKPGVMLPVEWKKPVSIRPQDFFAKITQEQAIRAFIENAITENGETSTPALIQGQIDRIAVHEVGTVTSGKYEGGTVYVYASNCSEAYNYPCQEYGSPSFRFIVLKDGTVVSLSKYVASWNNEYIDPGFTVTHDDDSELDVSLPATLKIPNSTYVLHKIGTSHEMFGDTPKDLLFTSDEIKKPVYADKKTGCIIIENNDGTTSIYEISYATGETLSFSVTWNDGSVSDSEYSHGIFGCDPHKTCYNVVSIENGKLHTEMGDRALEIIGKLQGGEDVLREVYTSNDLKTFTDSNMRDLPQVYAQHYFDDNAPKLSTEEFYQDHPVIYIKDPFGRWLRWLREEYVPAAECGKPVIYLYPTTTQKISVRVAPNKGLTITDPPYGDGWTVTATPSGLLTNHDGRTYPYLFWEGITNGYAAPKEGFVVERHNIEKVLGEKLTLLGLNAQERRDFLDYWVPKMQAKPYTFITFLDQSYFETLAPLTVSPKPDTVIRVFMDYRGLDAPIDVTPLTIRTPKRKGFTVVEWGGALNRE